MERRCGVEFGCMRWFGLTGGVAVDQESEVSSPYTSREPDFVVSRLRQFLQEIGGKLRDRPVDSMPYDLQVSRRHCDAPSVYSMSMGISTQRIEREQEEVTIRDLVS